MADGAEGGRMLKIRVSRLATEATEPLGEPAHHLAMGPRYSRVAAAALFTDRFSSELVGSLLVKSDHPPRWVQGDELTFD